MRTSKPKKTSTTWIAMVLLILATTAGCQGCDRRESFTPADDGGVVVEVDDCGMISTRDAGGRSDAGAADSGSPDVVTPLDAGESEPDGGSDVDVTDAGSGKFDWEDIFGEAGIPDELACIPGALPGFSLTEILSSFELERYQGTSETGVVCGDVTCAEDVPCCELCGYAQCAQAGVDGGAALCPAFVRSIRCDGHEDCPNTPDADTCCYTLEGTTCRAEEDCAFELPSLFSDGGFSFPSAPDAGRAGNGDVFDGGVADAGFFDGGIVDAGILDSGTVDSGIVDAGLLDGGIVDAGSSDAGPTPLGPIQEFFNQGVPVCRNSLFDCDLLSLEVCCTSPRIVTLDIGMCLPALLCFNDILP